LKCILLWRWLCALMRSSLCSQAVSNRYVSAADCDLHSVWFRAASVG
jgi:hypothetical protein